MGNVDLYRGIVMKGFGKFILVSILNLMGWAVSLCLLSWGVLAFYVAVSAINEGIKFDNRYVDAAAAFLEICAGLVINPVLLKRLPFFKKSTLKPILTIGLSLGLLGVAEGGEGLYRGYSDAQQAASEAKEKAEQAAKEKADQLAEAERTQAEADYQLGYNKYYGFEGETRDEVVALALYKKAAEHGNIEAMIEMASQNQYKDKPTDAQKAADTFWRNKATLALKDSQDGKLIFKLSEVYPYADPQKEALHEKAAKLNDCSAMNAYRYEQDKAKAAKWSQAMLEYAEKTNDYLCDLNVGNAVSDGEIKSKYKPVVWWKRAADQGSFGAFSMLGVAYLEGKDGAPKDEWEGCNWYRKGAFVGDSNSMYYIGLCYLGGSPKDWPQNYGKARYWLTRYQKYVGYSKDAAKYLKQYPGPIVEDKETTKMVHP